MAFWLVKSDPETYAFHDLVRDGKTAWDGVRNFQARNHLKVMKKGDAVLVYHSGDDKAVFGTAEVVKPAYPDPSADADGWMAVDLRAGRALRKPVTLAAIKMAKPLGGIALIRQSRLSVMPVTRDEYETIMTMGNHA